MVVGKSNALAHTRHKLRPGASGTGRTTFVNTLVEQGLLTHRIQTLLVDPENPQSAMDPNLVQEAARMAHQEEPIRIKPVNIELEEDGVRIALTVVDTPGFGDGIDNEYWCVLLFSCSLGQMTLLRWANRGAGLTMQFPGNRNISREAVR